MMNQIVLFSTYSVDTANLIIALVGYLIVFTALVMLYFVFYYFPKLLTLFNRKNRRKGAKASVNQEEVMSGEVNAAITMALYLFNNEHHDEESNILTIKKTSKTYSPWSSKIYSVRNSFNRI